MSPVADNPDILSGALVDRTTEQLEPIYGEKRDEAGVDEKHSDHNGPAIPDTEGLVEGHPTDDELEGPNALRRISAPIPWAIYTVAFVELCERFSYYGTQVVCMSLLLETSKTREAVENERAYADSS
jgi:hypothetical protein